MPIVWNNEPDYRFDALRLLLNLQNGETMEALKQKALDAPGSAEHATALARCLDPIIHLEQEAAGLLKPSDDNRLLFGNREEFDPFAAMLFFYGAENNRRTKRHMALYRQASEKVEDTERVFENDAEFFDFVRRLGVPVQEQYDLLAFYFRFEELHALFEEMMEKTEALIRKNLPAFAPGIRATGEALQTMIAQKGMQALTELAGFTEPDENTHYQMYPCVTAPNSFIAQDRAGIPGGRNEPIHIHIGYTFIEIRSIFEALNENKDKGMSFLKILGDPTKMSILQLLKEGPMFSRQLADRLALSGATISHHMNALASLRLVLLRREGKRIYYERNEDVIRHFIRELERNI